MEVIYLTGRNRAGSITYSNPCPCRYMDIRDPSSNKLEPKMETGVAMGHSCQQHRVTESDSNQRLPEQKEEKNL